MEEFKCEKCEYFNKEAINIWDSCTNGADYYCVVNGYCLFKKIATLKKIIL